MKRTNRRRNKNIIELTSLMDVVFIVLMVVIFGYFGKKESLGDISAREIALEQSKAAYENEIARKDSELNTRSQKYDTFDNIINETTYISITASYTPSDPKDRSIIISTNESTKTIKIDPQDSDKSFDEFREYLSKIVDKADSEQKPVFINYSDEQTLLRDDAKIQGILSEIESDHQNIYRCNSLPNGSGGDNE